MSKTLILPCDVKDVSDGVYTFRELYEYNNDLHEHKTALFIALCKFRTSVVTPNECAFEDVWRSKLYSNGSTHDGWFILGIGYEGGSQITYSLPISKWAETDFAKTLDKAPECNGYASEDILSRLRDITSL